MSDESPEFPWFGQRERWAWGALIMLVGVLNLWHWITGAGGPGLGLVGAIVQLTFFPLLLARLVYLVRQNGSSR
jgi:hypothetical protein